LGQKKVVGEVIHDEVEGVIGLDFDVGGRMISGGGSIIKVWQEPLATVGEDDEDEEADSDDDVAAAKRPAANSDDDDSDAGGAAYESSDDEEKSSKRKKRKRGKGPEKGASFTFSGLD
jgi:hypothetical protein